MCMFCQLRNIEHSVIGQERDVGAWSAVYRAYGRFPKLHRVFVGPETLAH